MGIVSVKTSEQANTEQAFSSVHIVRKPNGHILLLMQIPLSNACGHGEITLLLQHLLSSPIGEDDWITAEKM